MVLHHPKEGEGDAYYHGAHGGICLPFTTPKPIHTSPCVHIVRCGHVGSVMSPPENAPAFGKGFGGKERKCLCWGMLLGR